MTKSNLPDYKAYQQIRNLDHVFSALSMLNVANSKEILNYVNKNILSKHNERIERVAHQEFDAGRFDTRKRDKYLRDNRQLTSRRTVQRCLQFFIKRGLVQKNNELYSLTEHAKSEVRYYGRQFGGLALSAIMSIHFPILYSSLKENIDQLVTIFGLFTLYCMIEAARPASTIKARSPRVYAVTGKTADNIERDRLASTWLQQVFDPVNMYDYFLAAMCYYEEDQENDKRKLEREDLGDNRFTIGIRDRDGKLMPPPSTQKLAEDRFYLLTSDEFDYAKQGAKRPLYELKQETISEITRILKTNNKYRMFYKRLLEARASFLGRPKELSMRSSNSNHDGNNKSNVLSFSLEEDEQ
jgi:hypothetical protein